MNNSSMKHPNPNSLPINPLARTQSAPPEGKIHEFQDLKDKTNQFQNKNQESNQQVPKKSLKFNPHVQEFKPTTNEQINVSVFVPSNINSSNPLNLPINNPNQVVNDEKKLEIQNKMKKSLRLNPNSKEFHQNPTPNEVKAPSVLEEDKNDTSLGKWDMPIPKVEEKKEPPKMVKKIPIPKKEEPKEQKKPEENNEKPKIQSEIIKSSEGLEQIKEVKEEDTEKPEKLEKKSEEKEIKIEEIVTPAIIEEEKLEIIPEKVVIIQENEIPKETIKHTQPIIKKNYIVELIKIGRKSLNPPPEYLKTLIAREILVVESKGGKPAYPKKNQNNQDRNYVSNISRSDSTKEKPANESGRKENYNKEKEDDSFVRAPEDPLKLLIKSTANVWTKTILAKSQDAKTKIENNIRANLNKLTPDNFEKLKFELLNLAKESIETCELMVQQIIEKSWTEQKYAKTYAELCSFLQSDKSLLFIDPNSSEKKDKQRTVFKSELLGKIQNAFEKDEVIKSRKKDKELSNDEKKKRILGNVKFIGELYLQKVIPKKIIHICICSMLYKYQEDFFKFHLEDEKASENFDYNLEGIITLYDKVGKEIDKTKNKEEKISLEEKKIIETYKKDFLELDKTKFKLSDKRLNSKDQEVLSTEGVYETLGFIKDNIAKSKLKHLLENLFDRRENDWKETFFGNEGPKKISQLRQEHMKELDEIDNRANDFKEKEYDSRNSRPYNNKKDYVYVAKNASSVGFQVAVDNKSYKEEERKESVSNSSGSKVKLNFSVNRAKDNNEKIIEKKESRMSRQDVEMRVKSIFKKFEEGLDLDISEENVYDEKNMYSDLTNLCLKAHPIEVISRFLHDYYENSNSSEIELYKRVEIPFKLVLDGIIKKEEFLKEFSLHLSKVFSICSDFPYLSGAIVKLFFQFSKANLLKYNDIEIDWTGGVDDNPEEIKDDIQYTLKEFVKGSYKILKENGLENEKEEELKFFFEKIKIDDSGWFEKMKKS